MSAPLRLILTVLTTILFLGFLWIPSKADSMILVKTFIGLCYIVALYNIWDEKP